MTYLTLIRAAALSSTALIGFTTSLAAQDMLKLSVALGVVDATFNTTTASVFRLADDLGYFEKHGVDVEFVMLDGTPAAAAALYSGSVDLADISIDTAIRLRADNDVPLRGIVASSIGSSFLIAAQADIKSVEELVGRSYAIADYGSLDHALTQAVLRSYELADDAPSFVAIGAPDVRIQALAAGQVDATTVSFGTYSSIEATNGLHVIVPPDEFSSRAPALAKFVAGLESTIEEKSEAIQRFTDAMIETSRAMFDDREGWVDLAVAARPDLTRDNLERTSELNAARWCINGCMSPQEITKAVDFIYSNPDFAEVKVVTYEDIADLRFTTKAIETMGAAGGTALDARE